MTDIQLGNEKHVLGACRTYKRAMRKVRHAEEDLRAAFGRTMTSTSVQTCSDEQAALDAAKTAAADARERLLYLIETGEKSYPQTKKGK